MPRTLLGTREVVRTAPAVAPDDLRSLVTLTRTDARDIGQRQIFVRLDDHQRLALCFGEAATIEVEPGLHRLRVHNTLFWKTVTFAVEPGEHLEFLVINRGAWWLAGIVGVLGAAPVFLDVECRSLR